MKDLNHEIQIRRQIEYVPPNPKLIRDYASAVCSELQMQSNNVDDRSADTAKEFAAFLNAIGVMYANRLNKSMVSFKNVEEVKMSNN